MIHPSSTHSWMIFIYKNDTQQITFGTSAIEKVQIIQELVC